MCYQGDKTLHPSQEDTHPAISGQENIAILSNAIQADIIEVEDSDSYQPPKLPEILATSSFW